MMGLPQYVVSLMEADGSLSAVFPIGTNPRYIGFDKPDPQSEEATFLFSNDLALITDEMPNRVYERVVAMSVKVEHDAVETGVLYARKW